MMDNQKQRRRQARTLTGASTAKHEVAAAVAPKPLFSLGVAETPLVDTPLHCLGILAQLGVDASQMKAIPRVHQKGMFPGRGFDVARSMVMGAGASSYVEGFLITSHMGNFPNRPQVGHAWFVVDGKHWDLTHVNSGHMYFGMEVDAEVFKKNMSKRVFHNEYRRQLKIHNAFPYIRACSELGVEARIR
jgi:hypothetical protein